MSPKATTRPKKTKLALQQELEDVFTMTAQEKESSTPRTLELVKLKETEVREAVKDITVEGVVQGVSHLGLDVSRVLSDLSEKLVKETQTLQNLRESVELESKELSKLHKIDVVATSLDQLVEDYRVQKEQLEFEMTTRQTEWQHERDNWTREQKEFDENLKKQRQREKEEYEYQKLLDRKKEEDEYETKIRQQERTNKEKQEQLDKNWKERELNLKEKEEELGRLRKEVSEFPDRLKKEIDRIVGETQKNLEAEHHQRILLLQKDSEAEKKFAELQVKSLEESLSRQFEQMQLMEKQLEEAKKQVQEIAVKAIEGASGARALSHVNQIAMEQAKTRSPQG